MYQRSSRDVWGELDALAVPIRRRVYAFVADHEGPVRRDEVVERFGMRRSLAAYHLDRLVEAGLLRVSYPRRVGRGGARGGLSDKRYSAVREEIAVELPPRNARLVSRVLAQVVADDTQNVVRPALEKAARDEGMRAGAETGGDLLSALDRVGFAPVQAASGRLELPNCPFGARSSEHEPLVCGLNLELVRGVLAACGQDERIAKLDHRPHHCCVTIEPASTTRTAAPTRRRERTVR